MNIRPKKHFVVPTLALIIAAVALVVPAPARAATSIQINFGSSPHWVGVNGTRVREIRQGDRSDYDMFQYAGAYYAYNNNDGRWYMSRRARGRYRMISDRDVPSDFRRVPRNHWRNYPSAWDDRRGDMRSGDMRSGDMRSGDMRSGDMRSGGTSATFRVSFGSAPHWGSISGTNVQIIPAAERPDYDVFRYGNTYYAYNSNHWYTSSRESGDFTMMQDRDVPTEISTVPRDQWRHYPTQWQNRGQDQRQDQRPNGTPPGQDRNRDRSRGGR
jgi:hypothetical protein